MAGTPLAPRTRQIEALSHRGDLSAGNWSELLSGLIDGYRPDSPDTERADRVAEFAHRVQHALQGEINVAAHRSGQLAECTDDELDVLFTPPGSTPEPTTWTCSVPLVLIDWDYIPHHPTRRAPTGDGGAPSIAWIRCATDADLTMSLNELGVLVDLDVVA